MLKTFTLILFFFSIYTNLLGQCWVNTPPMNPGDSPIFTDLEILDSSTMIACGVYLSSGPNQTTMIAKSVDKGKTWNIKTTDLNLDSYALYEMQFIDSNVGYAVGNGKLILKTTDNGENWEKLEVPINGRAKFESLHFISKDTGYVTGGTATKLFYLHTTDGGETWEKSEYEDASERGIWLYFLNRNIGFSMAGGFPENSLIYKTYDGGDSWTPKLPHDSFDDNRVMSMVFVDSLYGWATGDRGAIRHTNDGGETWITQRNPPTFPIVPGSRTFLDILFTDRLNGWVCGSLGDILKTEDGGNNWRVISSPLEQSDWLYSIKLSYDSILFMGGTFGKDNAGILLKCDLKAPPPDCNNIIPEIIGGQTDTTSNLPKFSWNPIDTGCIDGYYVQIGSSPGDNDVQQYLNAGLDTSFQLTKPLNHESEFYVSVQPYNCAKVAKGCNSVKFHTEPCPVLISEIDTIVKKDDVFLGQIWETDTTIFQTLTSFLGCDSMVIYNIIVDVSSNQDIALDNKIILSPNPTKGIVQVELTSNTHLNALHIWSVSGVKQKTIDLPNPRAIQWDLNISSLPQGLYILQFEFENQTITKKLLLAN